MERSREKDYPRFGDRPIVDLFPTANRKRREWGLLHMSNCQIWYVGHNGKYPVWLQVGNAARAIQVDE